MSTLSETHFRTHTRFQRGLDIEVLSLAGIALSTGGQLLLVGPLAAGAALERRAANAVPGTFAVARSGQGTRRAGAGARRGSRAGTGRRAGRAGARGAGAGRARLSSGGGRLGRSGSARFGRGRSLGKDTTRTIGARGLSRGSTTTKTEADTEGSTDGRRGFSGRGGRRAGAGAGAAAAATATTTERRSTSASFSTLLHEVGGVTVILDIITRVGETKVDAVGSGATVDVGDEHAGEVGSLLERGDLFGTLRGTTLDSDRSAVHVHLTVTDTVEPGPSQGVLPGLNTVRDGEVEVGGDLAGLATTDVTLSVDRATTFERLDDHPVGVLGGFAVGGQTDLARTTTVGSTALPVQGNGVTNGVSVFLGNIVDTTALLARKVTAIGGQGGVVERVLAVRSRVCHDQMGVDGGSTQEGGGQDVGLGEQHCDFDFDFFFPFLRICI